MTRAEAKAALERATGRRVKLEVEFWGSGVSSPERRAAAAAAYDRVVAEHEAVKAEYDRIVREHAELQRLAARRKELYAEKERLNRERHYHKFAAYAATDSIGLNSLGTGDTWEEIIDRVAATKGGPQ